MPTRRTLTLLAFIISLTAGSISVRAQQPQIPTLQVCNQTGAKGEASVKIVSRADAAASGSFSVYIHLKCNPQGSPYPVGDLKIFDVSMSDSIAQGTIVGTTFEQVTTTGKHTPTVFLNGRCSHPNIKGCRFWMMIADNTQAVGQGTPDIISFLVFDGTGKRVAYGTGPVVRGDVDVEATSN